MRRLMIGLAVATLVLAACGKSGTTRAGSSATTAASATTGASGSPTVKTTTAAKLGTILVDARGLTLYHLVDEKGGVIHCTGPCTSQWPPLLLPSGATAPAAGPGVTGTLATIARPDGGTQVTYNGMPLYTYAGDSKPGDTNGQGFGGHWFVVNAAGSASATTTVPVSSY